MLMKPTRDQLADRFMKRSLTVGQTERCARVRYQLFHAAEQCTLLTPEGTEQAHALDALEQAMFLFTTAIAQCERGQGELYEESDRCTEGKTDSGGD